MLRVVASWAQAFVVGVIVQVGAALANLAALTLALQPLISGVAFAQSIRVDPSAPRTQQPGLGTSGGGKPLINIAPPSAGVSNNKFLDLSTGSGAIFNNSAVGGTSATGGSVSGNTNLSGTGPANVILNEVKGTTATTLKGANEIFGAKADLIIANPNGVNCDGCSFVNTRRATLSTGKPTVDGANISLHVTGGIVGVWGGGLSGADDVDLVGRHVVVDGPVSAKSGITASGGAQVYQHNTKTSVAAPSVSPRQGPYAVDATAVGAMTAGQIRIIGNESGLGVNLGGKLSATGNVSVSSKGDATVRDLSAGGRAEIRALGKVRQPSGTTTGTEGVEISGDSVVIGTGARVVSSGPVKINLNAYANISGEVSGSSVEIVAPRSAINLGRVVSATNIEIVAGEIQNRRDVASQVAAYNEAWLGEYKDWMTWYIAKNPSDWSSRYYRNLISRGVVEVETGGATDKTLTSGQLYARQDADLRATTGQVYNTGAVTALRDLTVTAKTDIVNTAALTETGQVCSGYGLGCGTSYAANLSTISASRNATLTAGQDIVNRGSSISATGNLSLTAARDVRNEWSAVGYSWASSGDSASSDRTHSYANDYYKYGDYKFGFGWLNFTYPLTTYGKTLTAYTDSTTSKDWSRSSVRYTGLQRSYIASRAGDVSIKASRDVSSDGSYINAVGSLIVDAGRNLSLDAKSYTNYDYASDRSSTTATTYSRNRSSGYSLYQGNSWTTVGFYTDGYTSGGARTTTTANNRYTYSASAGGAAAYVNGGDNVALYSRGGDLTLSNAIAAAGDVRLHAATNITSNYAVSAGGKGTVTAGGTIDSRSLTSTGDLSVRAGGAIWNRDYLGSTNGDLDVYAGSHYYNYDSNAPLSESKTYGRLSASIDAGGNVYNLNGGSIRSLGLTSVNSRAGSIYNTAVITGRTSNSSATGAIHGTQVWSNGWIEDVRYAAISGRDVELSAKYDVSLTGAYLSASDDLVIDAGRTVDGNAFSYERYQTTTTRDWSQERYVASTNCSGSIFGWCYNWSNTYATRWVYDDKTTVSNPTYTAANYLRGSNIQVTAGNLDGTRLDVVAGNDLSLKTTVGELDTEKASRMTAGRDIYLTSTASGIAFDKDFVSARDLVVTAQGSIINRAALKAARSLVVKSVAGNIENRATEELFKLTAADGCYADACGKNGIRYNSAEMIAGTGGLILNASAGSIINEASVISSAGDMTLTAGADLVNRARSDRYAIRDFDYYNVEKTWYGKKTSTRIIDYLEKAVLTSGTIKAGGDLMVTAGRDLIVVGSAIKAAGKADLLLGRNVVLNAEDVETRRLSVNERKSGWFFISLGQSLASADTNNFTNAFATLEGKQLWLHAGGSLYAEGAKLKATQGLTLSITGDIIITPFKTEHYNKVVAKSSGFLGTSRNEFEQTISKTVVASSTADAGRDLVFESGTGDIIMQAAKLNAGGNITLSATNGKIVMLVDKEKVAQQTKIHKENMVWWKATDSGSVVETILYNHLDAGGKIAFEAGKGVIVEYQEGGSVDDAIRTLSRKPELAWMSELQVRNDIQWRSVKPVFETWNYKTEGLTQGAAALIAIAVTIATQGAAASFAGSLTGLTAAAATGTATTAQVAMTQAISAGLTTLASRAAVSLANNKGDLSKVLKELGSEDFVRQLATSMLTAGLTSSLPTTILPTGTKLPFAEQLQANIVKNIVSTSVRTAINGGKFDKEMLSSLKFAAVDALGVVAAREIGDAYRTGDLNFVSHKIAHAVLGCAIGAASGGNGCASGAVGGFTGEIVAEQFQNWFDGKMLTLAQGGLTDAEGKELQTDLQFWAGKGVDLSKFAGSIAALTTGLNVDISANTAENAAKNNALFLIPLALLALKAYDGYKAGAAIYNALAFLSSDASEEEKQQKLIDAAISVGIDLAAGQVAKKGFSLLGELGAKLGLSPTQILEYLGPGTKAAIDKAIAKVEESCAKGLCTLRGGSCSFRGDTQVLTSVGYLPIRDIRAGVHSVWSRDDRTGSVAFQSVLKQYSNPYKDTVYIGVRDVRTGAEQTIVSNRIHPFFVQRTDVAPLLHLASANGNSEGHVYQGDIPGGAWVDADHLESGDRLLQSDEEWSEVVSVRIAPEPLKAYNVTVANSHTFYVRAGDAGADADAVWVHNCFKISIGAKRLHHEDAVADLEAQFRAGGYKVQKEITVVGSNGTKARADMIVQRPDGSYAFWEVKTGTGELSRNQSKVYPEILTGAVRPTGENAARFGLDTTRTLAQQGFPNGISVYRANYP